MDESAEEVHGFKLVVRGTYEPFYPLGTDTNAPQRYVPGTTQWIQWDDLDGTHPPPAPRLCTPLALHFCRRAVECLVFVGVLDVNDLALIRVTAVRWPTAFSGTPLYVEEANSNEATKCGAHGLRVDGEVTNAAERSALLSGTIENGELFSGKRVRTFADGRHVSTQGVDLLDNCFYDQCVDDDATRNFAYACVMGDDGSSDVMQLWNRTTTEQYVRHLVAKKRHLKKATVVYGELVKNAKNIELRILKRYAMAEIVAMVDNALRNAAPLNEDLII